MINSIILDGKIKEKNVTDILNGFVCCSVVLEHQYKEKNSTFKVELSTDTKNKKIFEDIKENHFMRVVGKLIESNKNIVISAEHFDVKGDKEL